MANVRFFFLFLIFLEDVYKRQPLEMATCFATIANMGTYLQPISFTKITDSQGNVILDMVEKQETKQIYKPSSAYQIIDMLYSALNGGGSAQGALMSGQTVCGKTGTNSDYRGVYLDVYKRQHYNRRQAKSYNGA